MNVFIRSNKLLIIPLIIFSVLLIPYLGVFPYRDGNIEFTQANEFITGGFSGYFNNRSVHPPLKPLLTLLFFFVFGPGAFSFTFIGYFFGLIGITGIYYLSLKIFDKTVGFLSAIFLSLHPLFLSVGIFSLYDYLITIFVLIALCSYYKKKYFFYGILSSMAVLAKETGLVLPLSVILVEFIYSIKKIFSKERVALSLKILFLFFPFLISIIWYLFLKLNHAKTWSEWIFTDTGSRGSYYTAIRNLVTFNFLNKYAYQSWIQLLILNFNWIYWLISLLGITFFLSKKGSLKVIKKDIDNTNSTVTKTRIIIFSFSVLYFLCVLSFQTYTIPRYALPIVPFLLILSSFSIKTIAKKLSIHYAIIFLITVPFVFMSLFYSIDPLSIGLWKKTNIMDQKFYALNNTIAGNDGITYNMQYLFLLKKRAKNIMLIEKGEEFLNVNSCDFLFPDINTDYKMVRFLKLKNIKQYSLCFTGKQL